MPTVDLVIGANYGDEGKGTITARLASNHKNQKVVNVLTNGGSQRGHSVRTLTGTHVFKHFGSGTLSGVTSYYPLEFIINPMQFVKEWKQIQQTFYYQPKIINCVRHPFCRWSTPYDMMFNQIECKDHWRGTCGMGIWSTIRRYNEAAYSYPYFDQFCYIYDRDQKIKVLKEIRSYYERKYIDIPSDYKDAWNSDQIMDNFIEDCQIMASLTSAHRDDLNLDNYNHIIFENGQGTLLCDNGTDDPEKTPSCTNSRVLRNYALNHFENINIHYITRPYITRHGSDKFEDRPIDAHIKDSLEINRNNPWQHQFKYAPLDISNLRSRILNDSEWLSSFPNVRWTVDVTHCDELDRKREFQTIFQNQLFRYPGDLELNFYDTSVVCL